MIRLMCVLLCMLVMLSGCASASQFVDYRCKKNPYSYNYEPYGLSKEQKKKRRMQKQKFCERNKVEAKKKAEKANGQAALAWAGLAGVAGLVGLIVGIVAAANPGGGGGGGCPKCTRTIRRSDGVVQRYTVCC